jgi:O-antigen ligase
MALSLIHYSLRIRDKISFNLPMVCIILTAILSIWFNNPPAYFRSWERLGLFVIVVGVVFPFFQTSKLTVLRIEMFKYLLNATVIITILSFIAYFLGINYAFADETIHAPHFGGITVHSMVLGPIASLSMCYSFWLILNKQFTKKIIFFLIAILFISFSTVLLAASRVALSAGIVGLLFLIIKISRKKMTRSIRTVILFIILFAVTFPIWENFITKIQEKQEYSAENANLLITRENKWQNRLDEFRSSPLYGIGYSAVLERHDEDFNIITGQIESGSSWLAVLSMLGILGFIPVAYLFFQNLYYLYNDNNLPSSSLLGSVLIFFMVHMFAEGYIFAGGSFMFFMLWLTLGTVVAYRKTGIFI